MAWWLWIIFGLGLLVFEVLTPGGFFAVFFGVAALLLAIPVRLGLLTSVWAQWLLFTALGTGLLLALRATIRRAFEGKQPKVDSLVGEIAIASDDMAADGRGKVELRGSSWNAHLPGTKGAARGARLRVTRVEGLWLTVEPE
jgi:hypothetical protein